MDTIFTLKDGICDNKINLDELYERKQKHDLNTLNVFNRILQRIHTRIRYNSRINPNIQHCWYVIPEIIIGLPKYDNHSCIAYIIDKLRENGFVIKYIHPNLLFISWKNWTPSYVREEIRKQTGIQIDGWGNPKTVTNEHGTQEPVTDPNTLMMTKSKSVSLSSKPGFKDILTYKPTGNLIYNSDLLKRIEEKSIAK
jgi:hypothetical protein